MIRSYLRVGSKKEDFRNDYNKKSSLDQSVANKLRLFIQQNHISKEEQKQFFSRQFLTFLQDAADSVPICVFNNPHLSCLETIIKYLKEELHYRYVDMAHLLNRSEKTIWATYSKAKKKMPSSFELADSEFMIPLSIFYDRKKSVLQAIIAYLKDECKLTYHQIAVYLNRDDRTIWTTYNRGHNKK